MDMRSHMAIRPMAAICLAALVAAMATSPVLAGVGRPDGWVRYEGYWSEGHFSYAHRLWVGNNIYNTTGAYQTARKHFYGASLVGDYLAFAVVIQNDGASGRFRVHATGHGSTVRYYHGTTNITSAIVAGTYKTPLLAHHAKYMIWVRVTPLDAVRLITITSVADATKKDAVKVKVAVTYGP